ncbi:MAG: hypothetical protein CMK09_05620 [Ponticaulis sp.]|nr:hypothetical protein [Ponticaulis sp.]|tara:strand:+ start:30316 stop:31221 length:906 start_codon:yes stop_codon:yes gene_type:complete
MKTIKNGVACVVVSLTAPLVAGCVSGPYYVYPVGQTTTVDEAIVADLSADTEDTIRTAKPGEILFDQEVQYARLMVLENTVFPTSGLENSMQRREVSFSAGDIYFEAIDVAEQLNVVACSTKQPVHIIPRLAPDNSMHFKACFLLEPLDDEIKLDDIQVAVTDFTSSQWFWVSGSVINTDFEAPFQALTYWPIDHIFDVNEPARFKVMDGEHPKTGKATRVGLRFVSEGDTFTLQPVYTSDGIPANTDADPIEVDPEGEFPRTVEFREAKIELLALTGNTLAYRVLSGFSADRRYIMDLNR